MSGGKPLWVCGQFAVQFPWIPVPPASSFVSYFFINTVRWVSLLAWEAIQ